MKKTIWVWILSMAAAAACQTPQYLACTGSGSSQACKTAGTVAAGTTNGVQTLASGATITAAMFSGNQQIELTPGGSYTISSKLNITTANNILDGKGATITCMVAADDCIELAGGEYGATTNTFRNLYIKPGVISTGAAIHDASYNLTLDHVSLLVNGSNTFANGVQVDIDEQFVLSGMQPPGGKVVTCNATYCGAMLYNPAGSANAAVGWLSDDNFSLGCGQNGINWQGGNDLSIVSSIIQAYPEYGVEFNSTSTGADSRLVATKVHNEMGNCGNPALNGINSGTGYIMGGSTTLTSDGGQLGGTFPIFPVTGTTGSSNYAWYVIYKNGAGSVTAPIPIGYITNGPASFDGSSSSVTLTFASDPNSTGGCTILRTLQSGNGRIAPTGTGNFEVATGVTCDSGTFTTYTDTSADPLTSYTISDYPQNDPQLMLWPGSVVLASGGTNTYGAARFAGTCPAGSSFTSAASAVYAAYPQVYCTGIAQENFSTELTPGSSTFITRTAGYMPSNPAPGLNESGSAFMLPDAAGRGNISSDATGVLNFGSFYNSSSDIATIYDSNFNLTMATPGGRRVPAAGDAAIGLIGSGNDLGIRAASSICQQINAVFASGTTPLECLTATAKTFTGLNLVLNGATTISQSNTAADTSTAEIDITSGATAGSQGAALLKTYGSAFTASSLRQQFLLSANTASGGKGIIVAGTSGVASGGAGSVSIRAGGYDTAAENILCSGLNCNVTHGTFQVGGVGVAVTVASGTAAMGTTAIASGACATAVTAAATGVLATDAIAWSFNAAPDATYNSLTVRSYVTAGNVDFSVCNPSAASVTPAAATLNWRVGR